MQDHLARVGRNSNHDDILNRNLLFNVIIEEKIEKLTSNGQPVITFLVTRTQEIDRNQLQQNLSRLHLSTHQLYHLEIH